MGTIEWEGQVGVTTLLNAAVLKFAIRHAFVNHNVPSRTCMGVRGQKREVSLRC